MDIEKIFRPSKWFVVFCGLFVAIWVIYQYVAGIRVADEAKFLARRIYTWSWPQLNYDSRIEGIEAKVTKKTDSEAVVTVRGRQILTAIHASPQTPGSGAKPDVADCSATMTFYKSSNHWVLGRLELD